MMRTTSIAAVIALIAALAASLLPGIANADGETTGQNTDYTVTAAAIDTTLRRYLFDPEILESKQYQALNDQLEALARTAADDDAFTHGFYQIWADGPFSHVTLRKAEQTAEQISNYLDSMDVGGNGAQLSWDADIAVLTVNTMMGQDTIQQIDTAYDEIAARGAAGLIIDLRANTGGAFAVRPLLAHLISEPADGGVFVSQPWTSKHDRAPTVEEIQAVAPWEGWSITAFWADVQTSPLLRVRFTPGEPAYTGPVYVLTSKATASAAELAVDAMRTAERVTIVGETTAGQMLSQKIYDVPGGFHLSLPIADYYSIDGHRIEGAGVTPDIATSADAAMAVALQQLRQPQATTH